MVSRLSQRLTRRDCSQASGMGMKANAAALSYVIGSSVPHICCRLARLSHYTCHRRSQRLISIANKARACVQTLRCLPNRCASIPGIATIALHRMLTHAHRVPYVPVALPWVSILANSVITGMVTMEVAVWSEMCHIRAALYWVRRALRAPYGHTPAEASRQYWHG